jgi:hypothetical protein
MKEALLKKITPLLVVLRDDIRRGSTEKQENDYYFSDLL